MDPIKETYEPQVNLEKERFEKTKKNISSDSHFYSYMKKLQQNKNPNPLQTSQRVSPENINKSSSSSNLPLLIPSLSNIINQTTGVQSQKSQNIGVSSKNNIPNTEIKIDFWDNLANNFERKQDNINQDIQSFQNLPLNPTLDSERKDDVSFIKRAETIKFTPEKDPPHYIKEALEQKDQEIDRINRENANLVEIKRKLENAVIQQNELMNDLRKEMILQRENELKESKEETITRVDRVTKKTIIFSHSFLLYIYIIESGIANNSQKNNQTKMSKF